MTRTVVALLIFSAVLISGLVLFLRYSEFGQQDRCLDGGGVWRDGPCEGARPGG
jgi:hypothetical protein